MKSEGMRALANRLRRRISGADAPGPVLPAADVPARAASTTSWSRLRRSGLRIDPGLVLFTKAAEMQFEPPVKLNSSELHLYRGFQIGAYSYLRSGTVRNITSIGRYTSIGPRVLIGEAEHPTHWLSTSPAQYRTENFAFYPPEADAGRRVILRDAENMPASSGGRVTIGNDVWIGANVMVRRGVTIGDGAVVGSGAFVNRDVPPYAVVMGLPARQVGTRFDDAVVERLLRVKWWEFDINDLAGVHFPDVQVALDEIERRESAGRITRIPPEYSRVTLLKQGYTELHVHPVHRERAAERLAALERS